MGVFKMSFYSKVLETRNTIAVSIPDPREGESMNRSYPVMYLMHGGCDNHTGWLYETSIDRYAKEYGFIAVITHTWNSLGMDMAQGKKYFTFLSEELIPMLDNLLPIAEGKENHFIAGLSLGGMIAYKLGLYRSDYFSAIGSFSSPIDILQVTLDAYEGKEPGGPDLKFVFGDDDNIRKEPNNIFGMLERMHKEGEYIPRLYQECGTEDFVFRANEAAHQKMAKWGVPHVYVTRPGTHEWGYWDVAIQNFIQFAYLKKNLQPLPPREFVPFEHPTLNVDADIMSSYSVRACIPCGFVFPAETAEHTVNGGKMLLHPEHDDWTWFRRKYDLDRLAEEQNMIMATPQIFESKGENMEYLRDFGTFTEEEFPNILRYHFGHGRPLSFEKTENPE